MHARGTTNRNDRGSAASRRSLKAWMLDTFGDGYTAPCSFCELELDWYTMTKDRYPIPGVDGGKYERGNVRPACMSCNAREGSRMMHERRRKHEARLARRRQRYAERRSAGLT